MNSLPIFQTSTKVKGKDMNAVLQSIGIVHPMENPVRNNRIK